jgi:CheY-like chemotaxis protein
LQRAVAEPSMARTVSFSARRIGPILLVDDYEDARFTVREALENAGYTVIEAAHGEQALSALVSRPDTPVSLIILDLQMPVMDGWRLLELLRCYVSLSKIPVIIVSGQDPHLEEVQHGAVFGAIRAPYEMQQLIDMVDACMSGARKAAPESNMA